MKNKKNLVAIQKAVGNVERFWCEVLRVTVVYIRPCVRQATNAIHLGMSSIHNYFTGEERKKVSY